MDINYIEETSKKLGDGLAESIKTCWDQIQEAGTESGTGIASVRLTLKIVTAAASAPHVGSLTVPRTAFKFDFEVDAGDEPDHALDFGAPPEVDETDAP